MSTQSKLRTTTVLSPTPSTLSSPRPTRVGPEHSLKTKSNSAVSFKSLPATPERTEFLAIRTHTTGEYRTEELLGREYIVVPVVALIEGVIQGVNAENPELALASEFGKFPQGWNGRPVVMDHPEIRVEAEGQVIPIKVSANSPHILEDWAFGQIFNARVENSRLLMEAWIDADRAEELNDGTQGVLEHLKKGEVMEVSTGLFTAVQPAKGKFNSTPFEGVWRNVVPDHLAFLPDGVPGACSVGDGCGANRTNAGGNTSVEMRVHRLATCECGGTCSGTCNCTGGRTMAEQGVPGPDSGLTQKTPNPGDFGTKGRRTRTIGQIVKPYDGPRAKELSFGTDFDTETNPAAMPGQDGKKRKPNSTGTGTPNTVDVPATQSGKQPQQFLLPDVASLVSNSMPDSMMDNDVRSLLSSAICEQITELGIEDGENLSMGYVVGFTSETVVFMAYNREEMGFCTYQVSYDIDSDTKVVDLGGDVQEVVLTTTITPITDNSATQDPTARTQESDMSEQNLRSNDQSTSIGSSRAPKNTDGSVFPDDDEKTKKKGKGKTGPKFGVAEGEGSNPKNSPTGAASHQGDVTAAASSSDDDDDDDDGKSGKKGKGPKNMSAAEYIAAAPPEVREVLEQGMRMQQSHRDHLIRTLKATKRCKFTDESLKTMALTDLQNLVDLAGGQPQASIYEGIAPAHGFSAPRDDDNMVPEPPRLQAGRKGLVVNMGGKVVDPDASEQAA